MWLKILIFPILCILINGVIFELKVSAVEYRLPEGVVAVNNYNIKLVLTDETFFETHKFQGTTIIDFAVLKSTKEIQIHGNKLVTSNVALGTKSGENVALDQTEWIFDNVTDILTLSTQAELQPGTNYLLTFEYEAEFRTDEMYGFYKSTYIDSDGTEKVLGSTQFQATHARKVFPCFDEPSYKATFDLTIQHPKEFSAISNAEGTENTSNENFTVTTFAPTPKMSTYILAFVVSDFTCTESTSEKINVVHEVCSRSNAESLRKLAVDVGPELLKVMEDWTQIPYNISTLSRMRQVAIPDFSAGAMENWGLLTYREVNLLWDEEHSSNSYKQSIDNVLAHEIAHMWFGNLVTTHWWSDTFLNEGFARFFQWFAPAEVRTDAQLDLQFVTAILHTALDADSVSTSDALSSSVSSPGAVSARFGTITYSKGGSVLRMIQHFLGKDNFKQGVRNYLQAHKFSNTKPEHLWEALEPTDTSLLPSGVKLAAVVENWIQKPGFPVLTVTANGNNIIISQKRFLVSGIADEDVKWYVPITYATSSNPSFEDTKTKNWLLPNENLTISNVLENSAWIVLNNLQTGFYRINYDDSLWTKIETVLKTDNFKVIHEINRAQLIDDLYNFAKMGDHKFSKVLNFFQYLEKETSYFPWNRAIAVFSNMLERTGKQDLRKNLSNLVAKLIKPLYEALPFDEPKNDDQIYTLNRVQANTWACKLGNQDCLAKAKKAFETYRDTANNPKPDKNLRGVVYCNGIRHSTNLKSDWEFLWNEYVKSNLATEKVTILSGLGCATDEEVLTNYLEKSVNSSSGIKQQDALSVFSAVYSQNPEGVDVALNFLIERYQDIENYYGSLNSLSSVITGVAAKFNTKEQIDKLQSFVDEAVLSDTLKATADSAIRRAKSNLEWTTEFEKQLTDYFSESNSNTADSLKMGLTTTILNIVIILFILY